jgi:hypothetical protein
MTKETTVTVMSHLGSFRVSAISALVKDHRMPGSTITHRAKMTGLEA